ncbi:hypothetical protein AB0O22_15595 [Streptomyces sp. NPDC091204]|uniref:hypothetical protein n=1 Tax=Streptomyces sp. NPDC091204 TaxID=3155299 RepID=UPI00341C1D14
MTEQLRRPAASYTTYREDARAVDHLSGLLLVEETFDEAAGLDGGLETTGTGPTRT